MLTHNIGMCCDPELYIEQSARTNDNITIFAAELAAIKLSLLWAIDNTDQDVSIFSDSYSSLQALASGNSTSRPNLLSDVIELVSRFNKNITFIWIPSHVGIKGNETADKLANLATANSNIDVDVGMELSDAYNLVDTYITNKWQNIWGTENTGTHYREIVKNVSNKVKYSHSSRNTEVIITRLRLGKCQLNAYLYQIGKHPDGLCANCNKPETVTHFLTECWHNKTCSAVLAACNRLNLSPTIENILSDGRLHNVIISSLRRKI